MKPTVYDSIRGSIKSGHVVFFKATTWRQKLITLFTGGHYSHCGIAVWLTDGVEDRLMLVEASNGGRRIVTLSHYATRPFVVIDLGIKYLSIGEYMLGYTGTVSYSYLDFALIGLKDLLLKMGIRAYLPSTEGEVCSEFVANTAKKAGIEIEDPLVSPSRLFRLFRKYPVVVENFV